MTARARRRPGAAWRLAAAASAAAAFGVLYVVAVRTGRGRVVEDAVLGAAGYALDSAVLGIVSVASLAAACAAVVVAGLVRRRGDLAVAGVAIVVGCCGLGQLLKHVVLDRPSGAADVVATASNSFPSGHMIAFASVAAAAILVAPATARLALAPPAAVLLSVVAARLVHDGWHRPSDVVGALLLVLAATAGATAWRTTPPPANVRWHRLVETAFVLVGVVAGVVAAIVAVVAAAQASPGPGLLTAGTFALVAAVQGFLASVLRLVRRDRRGRAAPVD